MSDRRRGSTGRGQGGERAAGSGERLVAGAHPVRELLRSRQTVTRVLIGRGRGAGGITDEIEQLAEGRGVPVGYLDSDELDLRAGGVVHQGLLAVAPPFPYATLEQVTARADAADDPALLVAVDGVTDPHNLGSIARTAEAIGAHGLLVPARRTVGVTPTVEKAAAGALAHLPVVEVTNLVRTLEMLHVRGVWSIGLAGDADDLLAGHSLASEPCVLVVGAEGGGLARLTRERCDALVRLPMRGQVASLNASVAAGVALYELRRQRDERAGTGD